jgi:hypothetical protein
MMRKSLMVFVMMFVLSLVCMASNPYNDGLDFVPGVCPPGPTILHLPDFPTSFEGNCKLIRWAWNPPSSDGQRPMQVEIEDFRPDPTTCGVYLGKVKFIDQITNALWYRGKLKFYYTRNYLHESGSPFGVNQQIAFRFVVKGDLERVPNIIPPGPFLILCTIQSNTVNWYKKIFVYGGLDLLFDKEAQHMKGFKLNLGHNDGWYTHHPNCSQRPIAWTGEGDITGHYCQRGWLFVSPGINFVFNPGLMPPSGGFTEEAFREVGNNCYDEDAIEFGAFNFATNIYIHWYQKLEAKSVCENEVTGTQFCQGMVYTGDQNPWITFFSMGYWIEPYGNSRTRLHLVEGNIKIDGENFVQQVEKEQYFYGFATENLMTELKLVDLASNSNVIGVPRDTRLLLYFYNAGPSQRNPTVRPSLISPQLQRKLFRKLQKLTKEKEECPFLKENEKQKQK